MSSDAAIDEIPVRFDSDHGRIVVGEPTWGKAHVLHCSYYNNHLLRTIWKDAAAFVRSEPLLIGAAAEQAHFQLSRLFAAQGISAVEDRKAFASRFYSWQGFGLLDFGPISSDGGTTTTTSQHYAEGWKEQFGRSREPVGFVTRGWLAGAASAIFDLPHGSFATAQPECAAVSGGSRNVFALRRGDPDYRLYEGIGVGPLSAAACGPRLSGNIDDGAIAQAIATLPLFGSPSNDAGLVKNFDVLITWHPHQYYDRISFECIHEAIGQFGEEGRLAVEPMLEEAGHRCAFRTFGGIWRSPEWEALVEPMCRSPEDWVHGMVAIINCIGWRRATPPLSIVFDVKGAVER